MNNKHLRSEQRPTHFVLHSYTCSLIFYANPANMRPISISALLLAIAPSALTEPGCGNHPGYKWYNSGMQWCGKNDDIDNYWCEAEWDTWCNARKEALEAVHTLCYGEWARAVWKPWENKYKCWPLHHRVAQTPSNGKVSLHVMFRMKNYRGHHAGIAPSCPLPSTNDTLSRANEILEELDPATCEKLLEIPIYLCPKGCEATSASNSWLFR